MLLLVGLGNPGPGHAKNRHNIGFLAVDEIVRRHSLGSPRARFHGSLSEGEIGGTKILVLKPFTYMNLSGQSVGEAMRFYKLSPADVLVIHDDLDLACGKIRVKTGGGNGGHNGLRSLDAHIGPDYRRLRIGIGHPGAPELVHYYVLSDFFKEEQPLFSKLVGAIGEAFPLLVKGEDNSFMNKVSVLTQPPRPKAAEKAPAERPNPDAKGD